MSNSELLLSAKQAAAYDESVLGGKATNMAWLSRNDFPVPDWSVVTTEGFRQQLKANGLYDWIKEQLQGLDADSPELTPRATEIREKIMGTTLLVEIAVAVEQWLQGIEKWEELFFAVRSSAVGEDSAHASFAGQMDSFLFQKGREAIAQSIINVFASAFTERAIRYRLSHGISIVDIEAAVIVQLMVEGQVSGVCFTAHPVNGRRDLALVSATYGTGEGIVSGECNTDEFHIGLYDDKYDEQINEKDQQIIFDKDKGIGTITIPVEAELQNKACLKPGQVKQVANMCARIAECQGSPQDIEWTIQDNKVFVLQTRPVTSLPPPVRQRGEEVVWDNSNIQESYCGVTTPLTFSYASRAYWIVYEETSRLVGNSEQKIKEYEPIFKNLLGLINGRVYYNINNWYRGLTGLPSFSTNKKDMERMMGLQDSVDLVQDSELDTLGKLKKLPYVMKMIFRLLFEFYRIDKSVANFRAMFDEQYKSIQRERLPSLEMSELIALTEKLDNNLLRKWVAPIINDFYVMMMNGKVARKLEKTSIENPVIVQNNLMSGEEGIESTEPTKFLLRMCDKVRATGGLQELIDATDNNKLLDAIQVKYPSFYASCQEYIELYGDRCIGELKLESITLRQDASFLFAVLRNFLNRDDLTIDTLNANEMKFRADAETEAFTAIKKELGGRALKGFKKDLAKLRDAVRNRENMRLARTRMFGLYRDIYVEIGNQLAFHGVLEEGRDIFYISVEELELYMQGRSIQSQLKPLVASRKAEYEEYEKPEYEPPHHFSTWGGVYHHNNYEYLGGVEIDEDSDVLTGIGCYPGVVEQPVRLIFSPDDELDLNGQILCTVRTDPGWAPLFPTAGGILVERGSTLSHSAVVARELGIPAVVNIPGITKILSNGENVKMDGSKGTITRLDVEAEATDEQEEVQETAE